MFESLPVKASRRNRYGTGLAGSMVPQSALTGLPSLRNGRRRILII
jgi:hypothetical protein